jgi:hypothetical protein
MVRNDVQFSIVDLEVLAASSSAHMDLSYRGLEALAALGILYPTYSVGAPPPLAHSLKTFFCIFPVLVFGNSFTTTTSLGTINLLIWLCSFAH